MKRLLLILLIPVMVVAFIARLIMQAVFAGFECADGFLDWLDKSE